MADTSAITPVPGYGQAPQGPSAPGSAPVPFEEAEKFIL
jgi:hypothetical protein